MYKYSYQKLHELICTENGKEFFNRVKQSYKQNYLDNAPKTLTYALFKDYYRTGNRSFFQAEYFDKRKRLMLLQILALGSDEYLEDLEQVIFEICNEFTWVIPAHNFRKDTNTFDYGKIDLFSAETAFYLAETAFVFKDKLSKDILDRIQISLKDKIVDRYEKHALEEGYFFFDKTYNNWAAVCSCSIALTYLYAFPERFESIKERIFAGLNRYIEGLSEDGYCGEGFGYWAYGFGFFCIFHDAYASFTGEKIELLKDEKIQKILSYGTISQIGKNRYLPFADGGTVGEHEPSFLVCTIEQIFNRKINASTDYPLPNTKALGFRALYSITSQTEMVEKKAPDFFYFNSSQVYINKKKNYSFVAKGGNNAESHNHNDVGVFQIVKNGELVIADLGVGEYTKNYFGNKSEESGGRYSKEVFVCSSLSHSVPIVNGDTQKPGRDYFAFVLECNENTFKLDIKKAYAQEIEKLDLSYTILEDKVVVNYIAKGLKDFIVRFVSVSEPKVCDDYTEINGSKLVSLSGLKPTVTKVGYNNQQSQRVYAYTIDYQISNPENVDQTFEIIV